MNNVQLFEYSLKNSELLLDENKNEDMVLTDTPTKKNELMRNNEKLIDLITSYETLSKELNEKQKDRILEQIENIMFTTSKMNYSAVSQYFMVWNQSHSFLSNLDKKDRIKIMKKLVDKYVKDRHELYKKHGYSDIILQVIADNYSHKRKGVVGVKKIEQMLIKSGIRRYNGNQSIQRGTFYLLPDKEGKKAFLHCIQHKGIGFKWSKTKQNKMPDAYIQKGGHIYIVEHKYKKEGGGGQNSANVEIVDFIRNKDENVSYISFLDGPLFGELSGNYGTNKLLKIKQDIYSILKRNKENYFVNTFGFKKLLKNIA
ncbi:MAG: hypothetical protein JW803_08565 [Endomicrobiales bacterium]|nr:hypothetical protein [Endomicrobiales bacterium]